ncbi:hypothetical protein AB5I41_31255 [Sphingomonas sp. MMS24-JH45]
MMGEHKPDFVPAHKQPFWLSSEDVHAAIRALAEAGVDKAACWDFTQAIYLLAPSPSTKVETHE